MTDAHVVLVHGAWAGGWVWDSLLEPLEAAGYTPHPVVLPGVKTWAPTETVTVDDLADTVSDVVSRLTGPVFLVGHSGGGVVVTQAAEALGNRVSGVVFIAGMMLPSGTSYGDLCDAMKLPSPVGISGWLQPTEDGRGTTVPPEVAAAVFFHEAPAADAIHAARRMHAQLESARLIAPTWTSQRFGTVPRLYIEATLDRSVPLNTQREMQRLVPGASVVTLDTDHAPQLSAPSAVTAALIGFFNQHPSAAPNSRTSLPEPNCPPTMSPSSELQRSAETALGAVGRNGTGRRERAHSATNQKVPPVGASSRLQIEARHS